MELLFGRELSTGNGKGKGLEQLMVRVDLVRLVHVKKTAGTTQRGMISGVLI